MTVNERIQDLVIKWLEAEHGIKAVSAQIDEDDWEIQTESSGGCDTCAYSTDYMELTVWYGLEGDHGPAPHQHYIEVRTDPLTFLSELLRLEDEAK
ncbi:hypothetical protein [Streptomyces sp. SID14515]|uniref:hypothetical protein n=1 Tax=Streptomyces sp. SID14515 TaxID=2706074 RepID=UPI0013C59BA8|nr:hypothetical protein [Streptomyces sp. SID14515]NEB42521.1 hypothetical protein [Streptomyces sp. SID14515]